MNKLVRIINTNMEYIIVYTSKKILSSTYDFQFVHPLPAESGVNKSKITMYNFIHHLSVGINNASIGIFSNQIMMIFNLFTLLMWRKK